MFDTHEPARRARTFIACAAALALPMLSTPVEAGSRGGTINRNAPTISGSPATTDVVGVAYAFAPGAYDADGQKLSFSIANKPAWASFSRNSGRLSGTPTEPGVASSIVITVTDGYYRASLPAFGISVVSLAPPPVTPPPTTSGSATLSWLPPTTRTDGSALTNLAGYRVRYGTSPGALSQVLTLASPAFTDAVIENLPPATYYFAVVAYDTTGGESDLSTVLSKTIQ